WEVSAPCEEAYLDLVAGVGAGRDEPVEGHPAQAGPVPEIFEQLDEVRAHRPVREAIDGPDGHRHVRRAGLVGKPPGLGHIWAMPDPVLDAGRVGAVALIAGEAGRQDLACHSGLAGAVAEELEHPGTLDGIVDGLPGLEAGERRLAGVEK